MKRPIYFYENCSCNPAKGGSGVCGCVIANTIVGEIEDGCYPQLPMIRSETCHICQKILPCSEDLYWHLRAHQGNLI